MSALHYIGVRLAPALRYEPRAGLAPRRGANTKRESLCYRYIPIRRHKLQIFGHARNHWRNPKGKRSQSSQSDIFFSLDWIENLIRYMWVKAYKIEVRFSGYHWGA